MPKNGQTGEYVMDENEYRDTTERFEDWGRRTTYESVAKKLGLAEWTNVQGAVVTKIDQLAADNAKLRRQVDVLREACEAISDALRQNNSRDYVFDTHWRKEAHIDGVTLTIADARKVYKALATTGGDA